VQLRLGELVYADGTGGIAANIAVPASNKKSEEDPAMQAALQLANAGKFPPPPRSKVVEQAAAHATRPTTICRILRWNIDCWGHSGCGP